MHSAGAGNPRNQQKEQYRAMYSIPRDSEAIQMTKEHDVLWEAPPALLYVTPGWG